MKKAIALSVLLAAGTAHAELKGKTVEYKDGHTTLEGYVVYDDAKTGRRPAVIVFHDWMGPSEFTKSKAEALARMGYIALSADIFGKGNAPKDGQEAAALAKKYKDDRALMRSRAKAALDLILAEKQTDPTRVAAIGFCFGGTAALELARSGAPLNGVVTFHGGLDTPHPEDAKNIKGKILVLAGGDDPHVPPEQVIAFEKEMRDAKVDWQVVSYGGAVHAFTIPTAGNDNATGSAYNASADHRSWIAMKNFFSELFGS